MQLFRNNIATTIAATFGISDTYLTLISTAGMPAPTGDDYFLLTVFRKTGAEEREHEVLKVTNVTGAVLTVERSFEGAAASQFLAGDHAEMRETAAFSNAVSTHLGAGGAAHADAVAAGADGFMTGADKTKLDGIAAGAEVNVNADWTADSGDAQILNKPTLGTAAAAATGDFATSGHNHTGVYDAAGAAASAITTANAYSDGLVVGAWDDRGSWSAVATTYPTTGGRGAGGLPVKGDLWTISAAGTLAGGVVVGIGDVLRAIVDTPGQTAANWAVVENNIGYVPENAANKVTSISGASTDTQYPSAKLVYDQLAGKAPSSTVTFPGFGTSGSTACVGNDSRLSDARTPTSHTHGNITNAGAIGSTASLPVITTTSGVLTVGSFGTGSGTFCQGNDSRLTAQAGGDATNNIGYLNVPQNSQSAAYTTVLADSGKHILHPTADTTARTFTIAANSSVAYPIGTAITFVNQASAGVMTIAITSDTMRLAGAGTTGSRTLAANGTATALKVTSTEWIISGGSALT